MREQIRGGRKGRAERQGLGQSPIEKNQALRKRKMRFSFSLSFHYICKLAQMYGAYGMVIDDDDTDKKTEKV